MKHTMMIGGTTVIINTEYLDNRTEEQAKIDQLNLAEAVWNLYDELERSQDQ